MHCICLYPSCTLSCRLTTTNLLALPNPLPQFISTACANPQQLQQQQQEEDEDGGTLNLSAKERRKLKNERREQLIASRQAWREELDNKLVELVERKRKLKKKGHRYEMDVNRLSVKGICWWMLFAPRQTEVDTAEKLSKALSHSFPGRHFQVVVPTVPSKRRLKSGKFSNSRRVLHPGCIFLHCIMDRQVYDAVKSVPGVLGFFGTKVGSLIQIVMPTSLPTDQMEDVFRKVQEEENDFERFRTESSSNVGDTHETEEVFSSAVITPVVNVGCKVRVVSGPYTDFAGHILESDPYEQKVTAALMMFGKTREVQLSFDQVQVMEGLRKQ